MSYNINPPEQKVKELTNFQIKALKEAEGHFNEGLNIINAMSKTVDADTYSRIERHINEVLTEIEVIKRS